MINVHIGQTYEGKACIYARVVQMSDNREKLHTVVNGW